MSTMIDHSAPPPQLPPAKPYGLLAEFEDVDTLLHAARGVRRAGYTQWDCFTPFPVHGLNQAMGLRPTILPLIVMIMGIKGCLLGFGLQLYTMATTIAGLPAWLQGYEFIVSGKPFASLPAYVIIAFELTILLSAITAFVGMLLLNQLPRLHHPAFHSERFRRVTTDRFFIALEADDAMYDDEASAELLREMGATDVERLTWRDTP